WRRSNSRKVVLMSLTLESPCKPSSTISSMLGWPATPLTPASGRRAFFPATEAMVPSRCLALRILFPADLFVLIIYPFKFTLSDQCIDLARDQTIPFLRQQLQSLLFFVGQVIRLVFSEQEAENDQFTPLPEPKGPKGAGFALVLVPHPNLVK